MPSPQPLDQVAVAERLGRLIVAADVEGLDPAPLLRAVVWLGRQVRDELHIGIDHRFSTLALQAHWPAEPAEVAAFLERHRAQFPAQHERVGPLRGRPSRAYLVEWACRRGADRLGCMLSAVGPRPVSEDCGRAAAAAGLAEAEAGRLAGLGRVLAGERAVCDAYSDVDTDGGPRSELRFVFGGERPAALSRAIVAVGEVGAALGLADSLLHFFATSHPLLGRDRTALIALAASGGAIAPEIGVEYADLPWETALRVLHGMYPDPEVGKRLGRLAGAAGGDRAMLRMWLGPAGLPAVQIWTKLAGGALADPKSEVIPKA